MRYYHDSISWHSVLLCVPVGSAESRGLSVACPHSYCTKAQCPPLAPTLTPFWPIVLVCTALGEAGGGIWQTACRLLGAQGGLRQRVRQMSSPASLTLDGSRPMELLLASAAAALVMASAQARVPREQLTSGGRRLYANTC